MVSGYVYDVLGKVHHLLVWGILGEGSIDVSVKI